MRSYADYLLLSGVLDNLPTSSPLLNLLAKSVLKPSVRVVVLDCGTQLGDVQALSNALLDKMELYANRRITQNRLIELMSQGVKTVAIRSVSTCSAANGICSRCYEADHKGISPEVGATVSIAPENSLTYHAYLAKSYSGSLVGVEALPEKRLPARAEVLTKYISEPFVEKCAIELEELLGDSDSNLTNMLTYARNTPDLLEKALFLLFLYGVYGNTILT